MKSYSKIIIKNVGLNPTRTGLINILRLMGADIQVNITNKKNENLISSALNYIEF